MGAASLVPAMELACLPSADWCAHPAEQLGWAWLRAGSGAQALGVPSSHSFLTPIQLTISLSLPRPCRGRDRLLSSWRDPSYPQPVAPPRPSASVTNVHWTSRWHWPFSPPRAAPHPGILCTSATEIPPEPQFFPVSNPCIRTAHVWFQMLTFTPGGWPGIPFPRAPVLGGARAS